MGWGTIVSVPTVLAAALLIYWAVVVVIVITDEREPTSTLAWLLVLIMLPLLGLVFYALLGRNWKRKAARSAWPKVVAALAAPTMNRVYDLHSSTETETLPGAAQEGYGRIVRLITAADGARPLPAYDVEVLGSGEQKFAALREDLRKAEDTINLEYYIWERDDLTGGLAEILMERLGAGVEVRILNDLFGNLFYKKDQLKRLSAAGAKVRYDVTDPRQINYRNHRKIVVIDGATGYTGGFNVGQEYVDGKPRYPGWRDTHVRFHGPAVAQLQKLFAARWHATTGESLFDERFFPLRYPEQGRRSLAQTVAAGADMPWDAARRAHMAGMSAARDRVWIQSPYFVPTPDLYSTMLDAALSGLDVRFMMTGWPDKRIAWYAAQTFFRQLLESGGRIYLYKRGFFHPKTMTIDGKIAAVGTLNMDIRSLALDKELMVWFYDPVIAGRLDAMFVDDMAGCDEVTIDTLDALSSVERFRNSSARLASNLL